MKLVKKTTKKEDKEYVNLFIVTEKGVKVPITIKKFGNVKQDYFRQVSLYEEAIEE